jgi:hypothetical protein
VRNQLRKFFHESLLSPLHRFIEPGLHPQAFLRKELRIQLTQIVPGLQISTKEGPKLNSPPV